MIGDLYAYVTEDHVQTAIENDQNLAKCRENGCEMILIDGEYKVEPAN